MLHQLRRTIQGPLSLPDPKSEGHEHAIGSKRRVSLHGIWRIGAGVLLLSACHAIQHSEAASDAKNSVTGRVVNADGQGIARVAVQVLWDRGPFGSRFMLGGFSMKPRRQQWHGFASGTTDAAGVFAISLPDWFVGMKPEFILLASKEGHGTSYVRVQGALSCVDHVIVLAGETRITGFITDELGSPVAGARVGLVEQFLEVAWTYSDEQGRFDIGRTVQHGKPVSGRDAHSQAMTETDDGVGWGDRGPPWALYASRTPRDMGTWATRPDARHPVRMILPRGSTKIVHVRDAADRPLRNEQVAVLGGSPGHPERLIRWTDMLTDDNGVVVIEGVIKEESISLFCLESHGKLGPGPESGVMMDGVRQIPLSVVDLESGVGLSNIVIVQPDYLEGCVFLGSDRWRSGSHVTFSIGKHRLAFMTDGYEPWSRVVSIDRDTQDLKIRLKKKM